jgi:hypothetical protein
VCRSYVGELVVAEQKHGLVGLQSEDLRLQQTDGSTVDLDEASALLDEGHSGGGFLRSIHTKDN